jgi:hypothetical protein
MYHPEVAVTGTPCCREGGRREILWLSGVEVGMERCVEIGWVRMDRRWR